MNTLNTTQFIEVIEETRRKLKQQRKAPFEIWIPTEVIENNRAAYDLWFNNKRIKESIDF